MPHASPAHAADINWILYRYEFTAVNLREGKASSIVGNMCCLFPGSAWWLLTVNSHGRLHHWQPLIILTSWWVLWPVHILVWRSLGWMDVSFTWEADPWTATPTSGWHRAHAKWIIILKKVFFNASCWIVLLGELQLACCVIKTFRLRYWNTF